MMEIFLHALSIALMVGMFLGGFILLGVVVVWFLSFIEWMNRGSH